MAAISSSSSTPSVTSSPSPSSTSSTVASSMRMPAGTGNHSIVIDVGTHSVKAGWAHSESPLAIIPSMVGVPSMRFEEELKHSPLHNMHVVGNDCIKYNTLVWSRYPIDMGVIRDWDTMCELFDYTFQQLGVSSLPLPADNKQSVLLSEPIYNLSSLRVKTYATMFEKYGMYRCAMASTPLLTLYALGMLTGVVVDSSASQTCVVPIWDGHVLPLQTKRLSIGGRCITYQLIRLLQRSGYAMHRQADYHVINRIKEHACYIGNHDMSIEHNLATDTTTLMKHYQLPDGRMIILNRERYEAPEILFHPHLYDIDTPGLVYSVYNAINETYHDLHRVFYSNIVLAGGTCDMAGFGARLEDGLRHMILERILKGDSKQLARFPLRVTPSRHRQHTTFIGASVLASIMASTADFWITKSQWAEHGERIIIQKHSKPIK